MFVISFLEARRLFGQVYMKSKLNMLFFTSCLLPHNIAVVVDLL